MVGLGDMPLEVLEDIVYRAVSSRASGKAGQLASVNSLWQGIVERRTFQQLVLTQDDIAEAMRILRSRPERFRLVRLIFFSVVLPTYSAHACTTVESPRDRFQNDIIFSSSMNDLLAHLSQWPSTGKTLELQLNAFSPTDARWLLGNRWVRYAYGVVPRDILHNRSYGSTLELYRRAAYPIPAVTKLTIRDDCERYVAVSVFENLLPAFTGLRDMDLRFWDLYKHNPDSVRRSIRRRMAAALERMSSGVSSMRFNVIYQPPADQSFQGQRTCEGDEQLDPLTVAYRNASQKMTVVDVHGMLGTPELFWPSQVNAANPAPFWPNLKYMEIYYHIIDPAGEWLFEPDRYGNRRIQAELPFFDLPADMTPAGDFRPMQNRFTANQDRMDDFYTAVSKAVANMPRLEHLRVQAITFLAGYLKPIHLFELTIEGRVGHATWSGTPPFEPSIDVLNAWRKMAYERCLLLSFESKRPD